MAEFDVGASSCHIGRDGDGTFLTRSGDDLGLCAVMFGVEDSVWDFGATEKARDFL